jgi:hypothetical protein
MKQAGDLLKDASLFGLENFWDDAKAIIKSFRDFAKYLEVIKEDISINSLSEDDNLWPGSLVTLRDLQELTTQEHGVSYCARDLEQPPKTLGT